MKKSESFWYALSCTFYLMAAYYLFIEYEFVFKPGSIKGFLPGISFLYFTLGSGAILCLIIWFGVPKFNKWLDS